MQNFIFKELISNTSLSHVNKFTLNFIQKNKPKLENHFFIEFNLLLRNKLQSIILTTSEDFIVDEGMTLFVKTGFYNLPNDDFKKYSLLIGDIITINEVNINF